MTMGLFARLRSLGVKLFRRERAEAALDDELRAYVDLLAAEYERKGMPPVEARRAALVSTGGIEQVKEYTRDAWAGNALSSGIREVRYAVRALRRSPAFLGIAIATLALGIGGSTAVFTVINGSLLRPLPGVSEPDRLVTVERVQSARPIAEFSYPDYVDLRENSSALNGLAAYNGTSMALDDVAGAARTWVSYVSDNFFTVLGVRAVAGRLFGPSEVHRSGGDANELAVLGYDLWQQRFGGARSAIGSTLRLEGRVFTIIGVAPPGFIGAMEPYPMELWIPLAAGGQLSATLSRGGVDLESRRIGWLRLVGRLAPGRNVEGAQRDLAGIAARLATTYPTNRERSVVVVAGAGMTAEERVLLSRVPRLLAGAVVLLLLIACGNVASLSLVRAAGRRRELATRLALGASRATLVRQVALEGIVIAAGAGLLGVLASRLLVRSATLVRTVVSMEGMDLGMDLRVLMIAIAASTLTAIVVALVPALQIFRLPAGAVLKDGGGAVRRRSPGQRALVTAQVGASLILLSASAIVFSSFQRVLHAHGGFDPRGLSDVRLEVEMAQPDTARLLAFYRAVLERAESEPAVTGAALTTTVPPFNWATRATVFRHGEEPPPAELVGRELELGLRVSAVQVSGDFFTVMRIPLVRGRTFTAHDEARSQPVAIVSRRLAAALWPASEPIGQYVAWPAVDGPARLPLRVVGVAEDTRDVSLGGETTLAMYLPYTQHPHVNPILLLRETGGAALSDVTIRRIVAAVDPNVKVLGARTLFDRLQDEVRPQRTASAWIGMFGLIALLLASIGLYGVIAQSVLQRTRELAVRSALGATARGILATVLGEGMRLAALGAILGGLGTVAALRVVRSLFTGVESIDLVSAASALAVLALAMLAATYVPARQASRLNPVDALRCD
jgi:predicted permease